jgi:hypothetical protein
MATATPVDRERTDPSTSGSIEDGGGSHVLHPASGATSKPRFTNRRSAAQRAASQRLEQRPAAEDDNPAIRKVPQPLIGCEAFYKYQQEGIKNYRASYNRTVDSHFESLREGENGRSQLLPAPSSAIGALAHERALRHVEPITEFVGSNVGMPSRTR